MEKRTGTALTHLYILKARQTQELVRGYRQFRRKKTCIRAARAGGKVEQWRRSRGLLLFLLV